MAIILESNNHYGVPFPLVLADRFFHVYSTPEGFGLDVFRWDENSKQPVYDVKECKPELENINNDPTGIVTFTESGSGSFLYIFRPKQGIPRIFGKIPINKDFEVLINDSVISVVVNGNKLCSVGKDQFNEKLIGIQIGADGSMAKGVNWLPEGMILIH